MENVARSYQSLTSLLEALVGSLSENVFPSFNFEPIDFSQQKKMRKLRSYLQKFSSKTEFE